MQARDRTFHHDEARAADLDRGLEVESAERRPEVHVVLRLEVERAGRTDAADLDVVVGGCSQRYGLVGDVGRRQEQCLQPRLHRFKLPPEPGHAITERSAFRDERGGVLALRLGLPHLLRQAVAPGLQILGLLLDQLALRFRGAEGVFVEQITPGGEAVDDGIEAGTEELGIEHGFAEREWASQRSNAAEWA